MTEQAFLNMLIQKSVSMILNNRAVKEIKSPPDKHNKLVQAEQFLFTLPEGEQDIIQGYIDSLVSMFANEEPILYRQGFLDGIRAMKDIDIL